MPDAHLDRCLALLREGTEVLRTGGGVSLTAGECSTLLDHIEELPSTREVTVTDEIYYDVLDDDGWHRRHAAEIQIPLGATDDCDVISIKRLDDRIMIEADGGVTLHSALERVE